MDPIRRASLRSRSPVRGVVARAVGRAALALIVALTAATAQAGSLRLFEASVGQGVVRNLAGPVTNALVDIDYAPITAEGGKLYGLSEVEVHATGNLVLSSTGFACQASPCLFAPSPFLGGKLLRLSATNDLAGETAAAANLLTVGVTGSVGYVVVVRGEYLDATGPAAGVGAIQTIDTTILVQVPEPAFAPAWAASLCLLAALGRARRRSARARYEISGNS